MSQSATGWVSFLSDIAPPRSENVHVSIVSDVSLHAFFVPEMAYNGPKKRPRVSESIVLTYRKALESFCDGLSRVSE